MRVKPTKVIHRNAMTEAQACTIAETDCIRPNNTVKTSTRAATQKVYHWTLFRSSFHHCFTVFGSDSSKACLRITRRSLQYLKFSIWRAAEFKCLQDPALGSKLNCFCFSLNHLLALGSFGGSRSERVLRVSSRKSVGKGLLTLEVR